MSSTKWQAIPGGVAAPKGFKATGVQAQIRYQNKYDVAMLYSEVLAQAAGVFTRNKVKAHPLLLTMKHLEGGVAQAVVANSGNANACVGETGDKIALAMAEETAKCLNLPINHVLVASTGVIGEVMPLDRVLEGIHQAGQILAETGRFSSPDEKTDQAHKAALAIMTTDTVAKEVAYELTTAQGVVRLGGMAKGSGMIHPNMGTMLGFFTTDAVIPAAELQGLLREAVDESFNMVSVDGDTSTNDMVVFLANGLSGVTLSGEDWEQFKRMVKAAFIELAKAIARDGEGATKLLEVKVSGARSLSDARLLAKSVCCSSLVKTAVFGEDANWGRILAAAGYSGAEFDPANVTVCLGDVVVAQNGRGVQFSEEEAQKVLQEKEVVIKLILTEGNACATAWGCDLTYDYVKINGSYRT